MRSLNSNTQSTTPRFIKKKKKRKKDNHSSGRIAPANPEFLAQQGQGSFQQVAAGAIHQLCPRQARARARYKGAFRCCERSSSSSSTYRQSAVICVSLISGPLAVVAICIKHGRRRVSAPSSRKTLSTLGPFKGVRRAVFAFRSRFFFFFFLLSRV